MKYLLIFFYLAQFCAPPNTPISGPPYFYMTSYNTLKEAQDNLRKLESDRSGQGFIFYGEPKFITNFRYHKPLIKD